MSLSYPKLTPQTILFWLLNWQERRIPNVSLSKAESLRLKDIHHPMAAQQFSQCRKILRTILGHYLNCSPNDVTIVIEDDQKPRLKGSTLSFNMAHTHSHVMIGLTHSLPIGVDCELKNRNLHGNLQKMALRIGAKPPYTSSSLLAAFTARESILKCTGRGLGGLTQLPPGLLCRTAISDICYLAITCPEPYKIQPADPKLALFWTPYLY